MKIVNWRERAVAKVKGFRRQPELKKWRRRRRRRRRRKVYSKLTQ